MKLLTLTAVFVGSAATAATSSTSSSKSTPTNACAQIGQTYASNPRLDSAIALQCLKSVPLDVQRSSDFIDHVEPFWQFQSTLAYLKDPPTGYPMAGADLLGGLAEIKDNVNSGNYSSQWEFEKDLYALGNILPHDFHFNLPLPLVALFTFVIMDGPLISVSPDGLQLPDLYFKLDVDKHRANASAAWEPSPLTEINGQNATLYLQLISTDSGVHQDHDANYNQLFYSLPWNVFSGQSGLFYHGAHLYGFPSDTLTFTFANGTTKTGKTEAVTNTNLTGITSGQDLFNIVDLPSSSTTPTKVKRDTTGLVTRATSTAVTSLLGYPSPVIMHPDGYTSGYFLKDTKTAVLVMQAFIDAAESDANAELAQQAVIKSFLASCKEAKMEKLIVDIQMNGGGAVFNGYDAFKQLFPTIEPFGASRFRATPMVNYFGTIFTGAGRYDENDDYVFQAQSELDMNGKPFHSWRDEDPNELIHGDNFTAEVRYNLSDIITESDGAFNVTGYLSNSNPPAAVFKASDIVMLHDGGCGSTCAIFAEMMKSQGGVRSVAVGGRPQIGAMQGVSGSKGAQVITFEDIQSYVFALPRALFYYLKRDLKLPNFPPTEYVPSILDPPLGDADTFAQKGRFNLRSNMHQGDNTSTPLQFQYEAANCRLFYTADDIYDISGLWSRVAGVAWGNDKCVEGSSIEKDSTMPTGAYDTVPFGDLALANIEQAPQPGLLPYGQKVLTWTSESGNRYEDTSKAFVEAIYNGYH